MNKKQKKQKYKNKNPSNKPQKHHNFSLIGKVSKNYLSIHNKIKLIKK